MGRLLAGLLAGTAGDVCIVARGRGAAELAAAGRVRLLVPGEPPLEAPVRVAASPAEGAAGGGPILFVVAVKGRDTEAVAAELASLAAGTAVPGGDEGFGPPVPGGGERREPAVPGGAADIVVLTVQNGLGHEETLARAVGGERVLAGALTAAVSLEDDGSVRVHSRRAGLALASLMSSPGARPAGAAPASAPSAGDGGPGSWPPRAGGGAAEEALAQLARRLARPWFRTAVTGDWAAMKWSKLLLNILGNATAALLDEPPAAALARPGVFAVERAAFLEALAVMRRRGLRPLPLPGYPVPLLAAALRLPLPLARRLVAPRLAGGRGGKEPSFLLDLRRGRATEAPFLLGAVAEEGRRAGVPTPVCAALAEALERAAGDADFRASLRGDAAALRRLVAGRRAGR